MVLSRQNLAAGPVTNFFWRNPGRRRASRGGKKGKANTKQSGGESRYREKRVLQRSTKTGFSKKWVPQMVCVANGFEPKCDKKRARKEDTAIAREQKNVGEKRIRRKRRSGGVRSCRLRTAATLVRAP